MSERVAPPLARMSYKFFQRKLQYFARGLDPDDKPYAFFAQRKAFVTTFNQHFDYYSKNKGLVDDFMGWLHKVRADEKEIWAKYAIFIAGRSEEYSIRALVHLADMLDKHNVLPSDLPKTLEVRLLSDLQSLTTKEIALAYRFTQSDALLKKVKEEQRIIVNTEFDLAFFNRAYLNKVEEYRDVVGHLQEQFVRILPTMTSPQAICQVLKQYSRSSVEVPDSLLSQVESAILSPPLPLRELDLSEVLLTLHSAAYHYRITKEFWAKFEEKVVENVGTMRPSALLSTCARYQFLSQNVLKAAFPHWQNEVTSERDKDSFRLGFCAVSKFPEADSGVKAWCIDQAIRFQYRFSPFDIAMVLRAAVAPQWYNGTMWSALLARFAKASGQKDLDRAMVYFAVRAAAIDAVEMRQAEEIIREKQEWLREGFEKAKFKPKDGVVHFAVKKVLEGMQLHYEEHQPVCEIYHASFVLREKRVVIHCEEWPYHLCALTKSLTVGTRMLLRHLNKCGWKVLIISNATDLHSTLPPLLQSPANHHIV